MTAPPFPLNLREREEGREFVPRKYNLNCFKDRRQELRRNQTEEETILWEYLRNRRLDGYKFYRQYSIGNYIADFYCPKLKLVVEVDGNQHYTEEGQEYDKVREEYMKGLGIRTLRFSNGEVRDSIQGVLDRIKSKVQST